MKSVVLVLFTFGLSTAIGQRVAPGVPPQHYQQPPQQYQQPPQNPQQYQQHPQQNLAPGASPQQYHQQQVNGQQQMQYQQVPVQQQPPAQVPVQQVPGQQVPVQQVPQGHGGHHAPHGHHGQQQVLNANIQHEREHIQEHMQVPIDTSKMSEAELQFHYFKMHDSDNNNKLDGCELIKSLIHWHVKDDGVIEENKTDKVGTTYTDDKLAEIIDYVLVSMDLNKDGYVDYGEYRISEEKSANDNKS